MDRGGQPLTGPGRGSCCVPDRECASGLTCWLTGFPPRKERSKFMAEAVMGALNEVQLSPSEMVE